MMTPTNIIEYCRFEYMITDGFDKPIQMHRVISYDGDNGFESEARSRAFEMLNSLEGEHGKGNVKCIMKEDDLD